jgi:hypothetical protein
MRFNHSGNTRRKLVRFTAVAACAAALSIFMGCGGGGGGGVTSENAINQINKAAFTDDAIVLAQRITSGPWIPTSVTSAFDQDLAKIRVKYAQLKEVHAFPDFVLTDLIVSIKRTSPWLDKWRIGTPLTGDSNVDALLTAYFAKSTEIIWDYEGDTELFLVKFGQPLNVNGIVDPFSRASRYIDHAEPNYYGGDGDQLTFQPAGDKKIYAFSHGWGDCQAGCISRHTWTVTLAGDGSMTVVESGSPLSDETRSVAAQPGRTLKKTAPH